MPGIPRRHHFVTKAYLEGFLEPGEKHLSCYMRRRSEPFLSMPVNLANIRDFHSFKRPDGSIDASLESLIEREIESPGIPLIRKLASGKVNLDYKQRSLVARLVGLQSVRVPYERSFMDSNNVDNLRSYIDEMDESSRRLGQPVNAIEIAVTPRDDPRLIKEWLRITRAQILAELKEAEEDPQRSSRETFVGLASALEAILVKMEWTVRYASGNSRFITSDRPVIRSFSDGPSMGRGLRDIRAEISFPLSRTSILEIKHKQWHLDAVRKRTSKRMPRQKTKDFWTIGIGDADDTFVESINHRMAKQAHLLVFTGRRQEWLGKWMKEPLKAAKQAVTVLDTELNLSIHGEKPKMTRKREWVVGHE
ncbi:MAG: DUF4238 domain-containing protein [Silvibacterium sp.]